MRTKTRRVAQRRHSFWVEEWQKAHKWISVQISAGIGIAAILYESVPPMKEYLNSTLFHVLMAIAAVGVIIGRLKSQVPSGK